MHHSGETIENEDFAVAIDLAFDSAEGPGPEIGNTKVLSEFIIPLLEKDGITLDDLLAHGFVTVSGDEILVDVAAVMRAAPKHDKRPGPE
jgi:hypothetical protein